MGAPNSGMEAAERPEADALLSAFRTIASTERRRHSSVLNYWLSIRGDKEFPPLHDLDPLELSDAGPASILLELISGGHDGEIRHVGDTLKPYVGVDKIIDAPSPSLLSCIAKKLPIVAISRDFLAFEDEFATADGTVRCWVTLLPLSAGGAWVDYVYALVSLEGASAKGAEPARKTTKKAEAPKAVPEPAEEVSEAVPEPAQEIAQVLAEEAEEAGAADEEPGEDVKEVIAEETDEVSAAEKEPAEEVAKVNETVPDLVEEVSDAVAEQAGAVADEVVEEPEAVPAPEAVEDSPVEELQLVADEPEVAAETEQSQDEPETFEAVEPEAPAPKATPGFAKLFDSLAGLTGFYGSEPVKVEPVIPAAEPVDELPPEQPAAAEMVSSEAPVAEVEAPAAEELVQEYIAEEVAAVEQPQTRQAEVSATALEGSLQSKLTEVRAKADEARAAKLRASTALNEGLAAAYDFALDAEDAPEEYLRLVEAQGLKIQLRSPMKPVVKLAFDGLCDEATIAQLEAVLAWALKEELPRGSLAERIDAEGGIGGLLNEAKKAA
ncbi:MAG: hypothetical protein ABI770_07660 [Sphingomicrobium sp.]